MPIRPFFFCLLLPLCAPRLTAQTTPDAAIINAAMQMNLIDQYRNSLNLQGTQNTNSAVPDAFFDDIPFFAVEDYSPFQGLYNGKTWNRTANKMGDTWLRLGNIDETENTICLKAEWYNGLVGTVHLEADWEGSNICVGEGALYFNDQAMYNIQIYIFFYGDASTLKGVCALQPLTNEGYPQCSTFVLRK
jgi:hypothetical protein